MLVRSPRFRNSPSWAELRLDVTPVPDGTDHRVSGRRAMRVEVLRSRGASHGASHGASRSGGRGSTLGSLSCGLLGGRNAGPTVAYVESERTADEFRLHS